MLETDKKEKRRDLFYAINNIFLWIAFLPSLFLAVLSMLWPGEVATGAYSGFEEIVIQVSMIICIINPALILLFEGAAITINMKRQIAVWLQLVPLNSIALAIISIIFVFFINSSLLI